MPSPHTYHYKPRGTKNQFRLIILLLLHLTIFSPVVVFGFEELLYSSSEDNGTIYIGVIIREGTLSRDVELHLTTVDNTAIGIESYRDRFTTLRPIFIIQERDRSGWAVRRGKN